jgi:hypothetical protein
MRSRRACRGCPNPAKKKSLSSWEIFGIFNFESSELQLPHICTTNMASVKRKEAPTSKGSEYKKAKKIKSEKTPKPAKFDKSPKKTSRKHLPIRHEVQSKSRITEINSDEESDFESFLSEKEEKPKTSKKVKREPKGTPDAKPKGKADWKSKGNLEERVEAKLENCRRFDHRYFAQLLTHC